MPVSGPRNNLQIWPFIGFAAVDMATLDIQHCSSIIPREAQTSALLDSISRSFPAPQIVSLDDNANQDYIQAMPGRSWTMLMLFTTVDSEYLSHIYSTYSTDWMK